MLTRREALRGLGLLAAIGIGSSSRLVRASSAASPGGLPYRARTVTTPDRLSISVQDWGNPDKPAILFIHGFMSGSICWMRQLNSRLGEQFRLVAYDWRGHGASDKPNDPQMYAHGARWADEIDAVIAALGLGKPILAGWSMAGEIIGDYLQARGDAGLAGINFVDCGALSFPMQAESSEERTRAAAAMTSMDTLTSIAATAGFIRMCTANPLSPEDLANWVAVANMVPWYVRRAMTTRPQHDLQPLLRGLKRPVMVTHGGKDAVAPIEGSRRAARLVPDVRLSIYEDAGHASFWEAAARYNEDLARFASDAFSRVNRAGA